MLIGRPAAYYSTPVTKTHDNKPVATPAVPRWFKGFPADGWVRVTSGEAMAGLFNRILWRMTWEKWKRAASVSRVSLHGPGAVRALARQAASSALSRAATSGCSRMTFRVWAGSAARS